MEQWKLQAIVTASFSANSLTYAVAAASFLSPA